MKKHLISLFVATLVLSSSTATFAAEINAAPADDVQIQLTVDANDPAKINEALESGNLTVSESIPVATYTFDDGSYIQLSSTSTNNNLSTSSKLAASNNIQSASVSLSAYSAITGDNLLLWTYTLQQSYISNGSKITWHDSVPTTSFYSPIWSLWNLDSEVPGVGPAPGDSNAIRVKSSIKTSFGVWEVKPQTTSGELIINISGNGSYTSSARKWNG
ncbi:hypothetical protein HNR77_002325 [Paenibacillus sp. JGP012]|uniref:hypothetical protein n=1 Tax=Paenibacillus sp. JGP012 TaxID=2735914 RepID=UPI0016178367|nr:hypothetical protein [Paenibacillus sp. JGP012]MBB6021232.1 hypothetical protein [Paenibacillus sp. JGP012]